MEETDEVTKTKKPCLEVHQNAPAAIGKALQNYAVLGGIVRNFKSIEALKKFRSLNQKCFEVGKKALLDTEKGSEHLQGELELNSTMTEEQKEYLLCHGSDARRVSLNFGAVTKESVEDIRKIIFSGLKNMDVLVLRFTADWRLNDWMNDPTLLFQQTDVLRSLRSIHLPLRSQMENKDAKAYTVFIVHVMPQFVRQLFSIAVSLEEIYNVDECLLFAINDSKMAEAVKSLSVPVPLIGEGEHDEENESRQEDIVAFASSNPKLSKLSLHELNVEDGNVKAILESSNGTLREIKIPYDRSFALDDEEAKEDFPVLPLIMSTDFFTVIKLHQCVGAQQFGLSFPNLEKVKVNANGWRYLQEFPFRGTFPTVRSLFMNFDPGTTACNLMNCLLKMFPSVESVTINWQEFSKNWTINAKVWNYLPKQVRRIRLYNFSLDKYENYGLDRLLTGVPKPMCKDLQKLKKDAIDFDRLRTKPSISSLEDLKSLKLYVVGDFKLKDARTRNYLSQLSLWGALDHLPGFKLEFVLPQDLVRDDNLSEVKLLLQPVAKVCSVSFYKRKQK